jgi:hypothetical protein
MKSSSFSWRIEGSRSRVSCKCSLRAPSKAVGPASGSDKLRRDSESLARCSAPSGHFASSSAIAFSRAATAKRNASSSPCFGIENVLWRRLFGCPGTGHQDATQEYVGVPSTLVAVLTRITPAWPELLFFFFRFAHFTSVTMWKKHHSFCSPLYCRSQSGFR